MGYPASNSTTKHAFCIVASVVGDRPEVPGNAICEPRYEAREIQSRADLASHFPKEEAIGELLNK